MHSDDLLARKREIRRDILLLRDSLSARDIDTKSRAIGSRLWQLFDERQPESIMFYIAFGSEVRTQDSITRAIDSGKTTIVPLCTTGGRRQIVPCQLFDLGSEVEENRFGILEPRPEFRRPFPPERIDLTIVPGVAFDERGYRIGFGEGYYDRFLAKYPQILSVGLAYEMQIVECSFPAAWDVPVHKIITEERVISCHNLRIEGRATI